MKNTSCLWAAVLIACMAAGCSGPPIGGSAEPPQPPSYWPTRGWRTSTPEQQGMDSELLADAVEFIQEQDFQVHSLLVVRNGYIVADVYFYPFAPGLMHDVASVTKSFTSTLVGIAIDKGYIAGVEQPVLELFPGRTVAHVDERKRAMTLEDLLTMRSGLDCHAEPNEITLTRMRMSPDWVQFMLDLPMRDDPGSRYEYCSGGSHLLSAIIGENTGKDALAFAQEHLFGPLGISDVAWPHDPQGLHNNGWGDLHVTPRDAAKLGLLYLHGGLWDGQQLLSRAWVAAATAEHVSRFLRRIPRRCFDGYGYQWWVDSAGFYGARGRGGQRIYVVPGRDMVVVLTGGDVSGGSDRSRARLLRSFVVPAARSVASLPANPEGVALLESRARQAATAPPIEAARAPPLPEMARKVSGRSYVLDANPFGLMSFSLVFADPEQALFRLSLSPVTPGGAELEARVGLDGVFRSSPAGRFGLPVAARGSWETHSRFVMDLDEIANINRWRIGAGFEDQGVVLAIEEPGLGSMTIEGRPADLSHGEVDEDDR